MEFLIEILIGFLLELLIPILLEISLFLGFNSLASSLKKGSEDNKFLALAGCFIFGIIFGSFSTWIYPKHLFKSNPLPGIGLVIAPLAAGFVMHKIGEMRFKAGKSVSVFTTFLGGVLFAFSFSLWRFIYAQ